MGTCRIYEEWRLLSEPDRAIPRDVERHVEACAECRRLRRRYEGALDRIRERVEPSSASGPDVDALRLGLARGRPAPLAHGRRAGWALAAAAMAAVVLAALGSWYGIDRGKPGAGTEPSFPTRSGADVVLSAAEVRPGQWIETEGTETRLSDARVADLMVGPFTRLQVGGWEASRTVLFLDQGRIDVSVRPLKADEVFQVRTTLAQVRVVGTRFRVHHHPGVETVVTCLEGEVQVETLAEVELARVRAGFEVRVTREGVEGPMPAGRDPDAGDRPAPAGPPPFADSRMAPPTPAGSPFLASVRTPPRPSRPEVAPGVAPGVAPAVPPPPRTVIEEARRLLDRSQAREAIEGIRRALDAGTAPEPRLLAVLGDALRIAGRPEEARAAYERAVAGPSSDVPDGVLVDLALLLQHDLGRYGDARRTWTLYLDRSPGGRHGALALSELATLAGNEGRPGERHALRQRLLAGYPDSPEAARAFAEEGREMLARGAADDAWNWFAVRRDDPQPALAETALAGLVQARSQQGRMDEARALAGEHLRRHPGGVHADEVRAFLSGNRPGSER